MTFGAKLKELREKRGFSQRWLAEQVGVHKDYLNRIENEKIEPPSPEVIKKISDILRYPYEELLALGGRLPEPFTKTSSPTLELEDLYGLIQMMDRNSHFHRTPNYQEIGKSAENLLKVYESFTGKKVQPPIAVNKIAASIFHLNVKTVDDLNNKTSARLNIEEQTIELNKDEPLTRQRFSCAHELGHRVLHLTDPKVQKYLYSFGKVSVCRKSDKSNLETEANVFAANLLMPSALILKEFPKNEKEIEKIQKEANSFTDIPKEKLLIWYMANEYQVSDQAMAYRLNTLNLLSREALETLLS